MKAMRLSPLLLPAVLATLGCGHARPVAVPASPPLASALAAAPGPTATVAVPETPAPAPDRCGTDLVRLLDDELSLHPAAAPEDLYRLVHEAILGLPVADPAAARARLEAELAAAGPPRADEPIVEDLDERLGTVRVNLRRWRFIRAGAAELWPIVEASARALGEGDRARLGACLDRAATVLATRGGDADAFRAFVRARAAEGLPPVPPGAAYRAAHAPSYRVVLRRFLPPWVTAPPPEAG